MTAYVPLITKKVTTYRCVLIPVKLVSKGSLYIDCQLKAICADNSQLDNPKRPTSSKSTHNVIAWSFDKANIALFVERLFEYQISSMDMCP